MRRSPPIVRPVPLTLAPHFSANEPSTRTRTDRRGPTHRRNPRTGTAGTARGVPRRAAAPTARHQAWSPARHALVGPLRLLPRRRTLVLRLGAPWRRRRRAVRRLARWSIGCAP